MAMTDLEKEARAEERKTIRNIKRMNLFIIRELVRFICFQENISIKDYYFYLFNDLIEDKNNIMSKCEARHAHLLLDTTKNSLEVIKHKFIECGISDDYFNDRPIKFVGKKDNLGFEIYEYFQANMDAEISDMTDKKINNKTNSKISALREKIAEQYNEILNLDGTLMIDSIRLLVNNIIRYKRNYENAVYGGEKPCFNEVLEFTELFVNAIPTESYNDKQYKSIYKQLLKSYSEYGLPVMEEYVNPVSEKNIYTNKVSNANISVNLMLIRTVYNILCEMDNLIAPREFYKIIDMTRIEYEEMISSGIADNKKLFSKLKKYHFPVALFRGDEPKCIIKEPSLKQIVWKRVRNKCTEEEYILKVKEQLFNVNHVEYAQFMLSMYSMYKDSFPKM